MIGRQSGRTCQTLQSKSKSGWTVISGGRRAIGTGSGEEARRSVGGNEGVAVVLVEKLCVVILLFNRGLEGGGRPTLRLAPTLNKCRRFNINPRQQTPAIVRVQQYLPPVDPSPRYQTRLKHVLQRLQLSAPVWRAGAEPDQLAR